MSNQLLEFIAWLSPICATIGLLIYFIRNRSSRPSMAWLPVYLSGAVLFDLLTRFLGSQLLSNLVLVPVYGLFEIIIFTWFFSQFLSGKARKLIFIISGLIAAYLLYETVISLQTPVDQFQSLGRSASALTIVFFSILLHLQSISQAQERSPLHFWLNALITLYFLVSSVWYLTVNFFVNQPSSTVFYLWLVFALTTPLFYLCLPLVLRKPGKTLKWSAPG